MHLQDSVCTVANQSVDEQEVMGKPNVTPALVPAVIFKNVLLDTLKGLFYFIEFNTFQLSSPIYL